MQYKLIDIGANLAHDSFDDDREAMMQRAAEAGVTTMIVTGSNDASNRRAAELAEANPGVLYSTAGVHPHHASDYTDASDALIRTLVQQPAVVAVGECGLDYFRNFSPREAQLEAFRRQLNIAKDTGLPVFLHQRDQRLVQFVCLHDSPVDMTKFYGKIRELTREFDAGPPQTGKKHRLEAQDARISQLAEPGRSHPPPNP